MKCKTGTFLRVPSDSPLVIDLHPSRFLAWAVVGTGCATLVLILVLPLFIWIQLPLFILVFLCFFQVYQRDVAVASPFRVTQIIWEDKNQWRLVTRSGQSIKASLERDSVLWSKLLVLNFRWYENARKRSLVIFSDSANYEQLRRLRVHLKIQLTQIFEVESQHKK